MTHVAEPATLRFRDNHHDRGSNDETRKGKRESQEHEARRALLRVREELRILRRIRAAEGRDRRKQQTALREIEKHRPMLKPKETYDDVGVLSPLSQHIPPILPSLRVLCGFGPVLDGGSSRRRS